MIYSTTTKSLEQYWFFIVNIKRGLEDNQEMCSSKFKALTIRIINYQRAFKFIKDDFLQISGIIHQPS